MLPIRFNTVAFDLDGTLADTAPDLTAALNHTLELLGRDRVDPPAVRHLAGHGARALLRFGLRDEGDDAASVLVERGVPIFLEYCEAHICDASRPGPGIEAALDELRLAGVALAICTNKPEGLSRKLVDSLGWSGRFRAIVGADTLPVRKPHPAPLREAVARAGGGPAAFVGDSIVDAQTARSAGLPFVAVSFGFSDRPIEALGADATIYDYGQLAATLAHL